MATCAPYYPGCGGSYGGYEAQPSCPLMATYNSLTSQCECMSGYVASGNSCITGSQWCSNKYGFNSEYDSLKKECKCRYGYVWNNAVTKCISENESCQNQFGYNSKTTLSGDQCECKNGYVWDSSGTKCVSEDESCQSQYGYNAKASLTGGQCECRYGYSFNKAKTKCITKDAACQELNGPMSRSNLSGECECLDGYEYNGSQCTLTVKEKTTSPDSVETDEYNDVTPTAYILSTPKPNIIKTKPTKVPSPTIVSNTPLPTLEFRTSPPNPNPNNQLDPVGDFFSRLFSWLFGKNK